MNVQACSYSPAHALVVISPPSAQFMLLFLAF